MSAASVLYARDVVNPGTAGLTVLAHARWPAPGSEAEQAPRPLAGFVISSFSPLVAHVAESCLRRRHGTAPPIDARTAERTGIVVASTHGDMATALAVAQAVDGGGRVSPLLFFQSAPTAVAGHLATRWGLAGPVVSTSPNGNALADGLADAALLIEDGDADEVLLVAAEQARSRGERDAAVALIVAADGGLTGQEGIA